MVWSTDFEAGARFQSNRLWKRLNSAQELINKVGHLPAGYDGMHFKKGANIR